MPGHEFGGMTETEYSQLIDYHAYNRLPDFDLPFAELGEKDRMTKVRSARFGVCCLFVCRRHNEVK
jgi:hypothetical protein